MPAVDYESQFRFLLACIKHSANGKVNFTAVADELGIVSKAAAAKRYERLLKAHDILPSSLMGRGNEANGSAPATATPAPKKANGRKRKAAAVEPEDDSESEEMNARAIKKEKAIKAEKGVKKEPGVKTETAIKNEDDADTKPAARPTRTVPKRQTTKKVKAEPISDSDEIDSKKAVKAKRPAAKKVKQEMVTDDEVDTKDIKPSQAGADSDSSSPLSSLSDIPEYVGSPVETKTGSAVVHDNDNVVTIDDDEEENKDFIVCNDDAYDSAGEI
ncbi:hypothetical protein QBC47DRAFT_397145 [Echria macrotheca]|uniref:Myb-like DNA-binding domain-containing protein n=1 Tax=Echria macrotheca TaxID=438768 RepID=A0AAJ0FBJ6_9PEZI|nr:hypothetical protein QBC47DRAFT_397145 [Echria macrotheca]